LDFLVVADHSDGFGFFPLLFKGDPSIVADPQGRRWYEMLQNGQGAAVAVDIITSFGKGAISKAILPVPGTVAYQDAWEKVIKAADEANDPGRFPRSSDSSGLPTLEGTTFTATSSFATMEIRPALLNRIRRRSLSAATIPATFGSG
jgi:hypothetical protein